MGTFHKGNLHSVDIKSLGKLLGGFGILLGSVAVLPGSVANAAQSPSKATEAYFGNRLASLQDPAAQPGDAFGASVSEDGTTAIVGADGTDDSAGAAYIYVKAASGWPTSPTVTLPDPTPGQNSFGSSVAIFGNYVIVGADEANSGAGAAYVYSFNGSEWPTTPTVTLSGGPDNGFGFSVSFSETGFGPEALVGGSNDSSVDLYSGSISAWPAGPTKTLNPVFRGGGFGYSVSIAYFTAIVGCKGSEFADLYIASDRGWNRSVKESVLNSGQKDSAEFGYAVSTTGSTTIAGSIGEHNGKGVTYLYQGSTWSRSATLKVSGTEGFGASVALGDKTAVIGDMTDNVYFYKEAHQDWGTEPASTLHDPGGSMGDMFGASVSASKDSALVGAPGTDDGSGAAYLYHA